jgi:hypothetical protein
VAAAFDPIWTWNVPAEIVVLLVVSAPD